MYALIENGAIVEFPIFSLFERFPLTSFALPLSVSQYPDGIVDVIDDAYPEFGPMFYAELDELPRYENGQWIRRWNIVRFSDDEIQQRIDEIRDWADNEVNIKLQQIDTLKLNFPDKTAQLDTYRDELNAISQQAGYPAEIIWPTSPV